MTFTFTPFGQLTGGGGGGGPVTAADITDSTTVGRNLVTAASAAAAQTAIGASTVGKAVLVAADAAAGRTALGAGTSSLVLGTTAGTALAGDTAFTKTTVGLANVDNTSDAAKPVSTLQAAAIAAKEPTITAGTNSQYWRGDKTWVALDKAAVGLGNVTNTADTAKPVSSAQQAALDLKVDNSAGVHLTGNETIAGVKTFSSAPAVPDSSFTIAKTTGLQAALDARVIPPEIAEADLVDETDTAVALISGRRMQKGVDAYTGGTQTILWNSGTSSWPSGRLSAAKWIFDSKGYPAATAPVGHSVADEWWRDPSA